MIQQISSLVVKELNTSSLTGKYCPGKLSHVPLRGILYFMQIRVCNPLFIQVNNSHKEDSDQGL